MLNSRLVKSSINPSSPSIISRIARSRRSSSAAGFLSTVIGPGVAADVGGTVVAALKAVLSLSAVQRRVVDQRPSNQSDGYPIGRSPRYAKHPDPADVGVFPVQVVGDDLNTDMKGRQRRTVMAQSGQPGLPAVRKQRFVLAAV